MRKLRDEIEFISVPAPVGKALLLLCDLLDKRLETIEASIDKKFSQLDAKIDNNFYILKNIARGKEK